MKRPKIIAQLRLQAARAEPPIAQGTLMSIAIFQDVIAGRAPAPVVFTVEQFHRMLADGIVGDGEPVELINGVLLPKNRAARGENLMVHGKRHAVAIAQISELLAPLLARAGCHLRAQLPVTLSSNSEPEPDVAVVSGRSNDYLQRHPGPDDVWLAIEVADSSLVFDRKTKYELYAQAGIQRCWIVNLVDDQVEVFESPLPDEGRYAAAAVYKPGDQVPLLLPSAAPVMVPAEGLLALP